MIIFVAELVAMSEWPLWLPIVVSGAVLVVSVVVFVASFGRRKKDRFIAIYETMVDSDRQYGRRLLYRYFQDGDRTLDGLWIAAKADPDNHDLDAVNNSVGFFDSLGFYVSEGWVNRDTVLDLWERQLVKIQPAAVEYLAQREVRDSTEKDQKYLPLWPHFRDLMADAEANLEVVAGDLPLYARLRHRRGRKARAKGVRLEIDRKVESRVADLLEIEEQRKAGDADLEARPEEPASHAGSSEAST